MARTIVITGAFGALGRAATAAFAAEGDRIARVDRAPIAPELLTGALDLGGVDLTRYEAAEKIVSDVEKAFGSFDVLVNIAGGFSWRTLEDGGAESWLAMFEINTLTCLHMSRAALPALRAARGGRIINVGASAALVAGAGTGAYAASKSGVHRLTESLAEETKNDDITVNAVLPTMMDTPANRADMPDGDTVSWVRPAAVADVIVFLASAAARGINGALIPISRAA